MTNKYNKFFVTGGTGTLGRAVVDFLYENTNSDIVVFSRDEFKQSQMAREYSNRVKFHIGDIRDIRSIRKSMRGCDFVIHSSALKHIDIGEFNPHEFIKTNIDGTTNVVDVAQEYGIKNLIGISTDKASDPSSLYGATKLISDKIVIDANYTVVRLGNIIASRGSFLEYAGKLDEIQITDENMTRFWISKYDASKFIFSENVMANSGCIVIPKMKSIKLGDMINGLFPLKKKKIVGLRHGEKMHETAISDFESSIAVELHDCYVIHTTRSDAMLHINTSNGRIITSEITSETVERYTDTDDILNELRSNF